MPPQKRARSEPAEPAPELTTSTAPKKVSMTATLDAIPHCRTKAEVIAAIESHLVPSAHGDDEFTRIDVSRFPEKYRRYLDKATASLSAEPPTYAMMNFLVEKTRGRSTPVALTATQNIQICTLSICALAPTSSSRRSSSRGSRSAGRNRFMCRQGRTRNKVSHTRVRPGRRCRCHLPEHMHDFASSKLYDVERSVSAEGSPDFFSISARGTMLAERCDLSQSVVGRHFKLKGLFSTSTSTIFGP